MANTRAQTALWSLCHIEGFNHYPGTIMACGFASSKPVLAVTGTAFPSFERLALHLNFEKWPILHYQVMAADRDILKSVLLQRSPRGSYATVWTARHQKVSRATLRRTQLELRKRLGRAFAVSELDLAAWTQLY